MAVSMKFYSNFSKRENSTKQPSGGTGYSVIFKDAFSIVGGIVKLQANFDVAKNYTAASYGSNFYNVVDVVSVNNGIVEITLSLDVLATYKSNIASYTSMIERSPSDSQITNIADNTINPLPQYNKIAKATNVYSLGVCFQIKTQNGNGDLAYFLDLAGFNNLLGKFEAAFWTDETKYIVSTKVVTISASSCGGTSTSSVYIGNQPYNITEGSCYTIKSQNYITLKSNSLNTSSLTTNFSDERRYNNDYVKLQCLLNGDVIDLDSNYLRCSSFITESHLDPITLDVRIEVKISDGNMSYLIVSTNTNIGMGFMFTDVPNSLDIVTATISSVKSSGNVSIPEILASGYKAGMNVSTAGAPGGSAIAGSLYGDITFYLTEYSSTAKNPTELGYPYMLVTNINSVGLAGFYKFVSPQLSLATLDGVKASVNSYLSNGIFYE